MRRAPGWADVGAVVDGSDAKFNSYWTRELLPSELGLAQSHFKTWQQIVEGHSGKKGSGVFMVLEDDTVFKVKLSPGTRLPLNIQWAVERAHQTVQQVGSGVLRLAVMPVLVWFFASLSP